MRPGKLESLSDEINYCKNDIGQKNTSNKIGQGLDGRAFNQGIYDNFNENDWNKLDNFIDQPDAQAYSKAVFGFWNYPKNL